MNKITAITIATSLSAAPTAGAVDSIENYTEELNEKNNLSEINEGIEALSSLVGTVTTDSLNVRSTPNTSKAPIGKLTRGETVDIISQESNGWYKINFNGKIGYVSNSYIDVKGNTDVDYSIENMNKTGEVTGVSSTIYLNVRNTPNTSGAILYKLKNGTEVNITGKTSNGWYRIVKDGKVGFASGKYIKEKDSIVAGKVVNVASGDTLNVRQKSSASSKVLYTLKNNTSVNILERLSNGWVKISYNGTVGYANGKYIEEISIDEIPNTPMPDTSVKGQIYEVTNPINLRKKASWSAEIIKVVNKGEYLDVVSISNDWAKVYINGDYAYAPAMYLNKVEVQIPEDSKPQTITYIATQDINLRENNSWSGNIIHVVKKGEKVEVIEKGEEWAKVYHMNTVVYAPSRYLELDENAVRPDVPVAPETTNYIVKVDVNMRDTNSWSGTVLRLVKAGETVKVISIDGEWAKIYDNGVYGYIPSQYIESENKEEIKPEEPTTPEAPVVPEAVEYVVTGDTEMRATDSLSSDVIKIIKTGEVVNVVEIKGEWAKIYDNGTYGYIPSKYLINEDEMLPEIPEDNVTPDTPNNPETPDDTITPENPENPEEDEKPETPEVSETVEYLVTADINMRTRASWSGQIIKVIYTGATVNVVSIEGEWAKIKEGSTYGYVPAKYVTKKESSNEQESNVKYTLYPYTLSGYVEVQRSRVPSYSTSQFMSYINPDLGNKYEFLELNKFREINVSKLNTLLANNNAGVLMNQGQAIYDAAKKHNIDALYFVSQSIHETGYGKSTLAKGVTITEIANEDKPIKDSNGNITGYEMIPLDKPTTVYNLYGIGAKDNLSTMPNRALVLGTTRAYHEGWTSVEAAIEGAAKFVSTNYINSKKYNQNTIYKMRFNPSPTYIWHQYATSPWYSREIAKLMEKFDEIYESNVTHTYDKPKFTDSKSKEIETAFKLESDYELKDKMGKPDITKEEPWKN